MNRLKKISIHKEVKSKTQYLCKCDICGYEEIVRDDRYETSVCKQCYKKELDKVRNQGIRTNYQMKTILLHWMRMIDNFEVVEEWKKFLNFYRDVYDRYMIVHDKQIDANDVIFIKPIDGILTPDNFKFDIKFSKKRRQEYEYRGIKLTWRQLIECSGTTEKVVRNRLADNWDIEEIFSTPSKLIGTNKPTQKEIDSIKLEEHNNLKIIERIDGFARDKEKHLNFFIKVRCKCGNEFITNNKAYQLLSSCGCIPNKQLTFDYEITKNYWKNLISRFRKQKLSYTPNWDNFDNFLDEVGYKPENKVLRRIDENIEYGKNNVVWINQNMDTPQDQLYLEELGKNKQLKVKCFKEIDITINYLKNLEFEETYLITNGKFYIKFIEEFKKNIREICVVPKIIILTTDKKDFLTKNPEYKNFEKDPYYNLGGIQTSFDDIKKFIFKKNEPKKEIKEFKDNKNNQNNQISRFLTNNQNDKDLIFDYVDDKLKLVYPLLYKSLIKINKNDNINLFTGSLYDKYKKFKDIYDLFNPIIDLSNVPIELLSKYYARLQTLQTAFYTDINKDLRENNKENYLIYIKVLYEGLKLKSFKLSEDEVLYRGGKLSNNEIEKIKKDLKDLANKKEKEPGIIVFSKTFLSFSKEESIAKEFLGDREKGLNKVIFILENTKKIDYNLSTHADIEKISFYPIEKEVLFFPFSAFKIKEMNEKKVKEEAKTKEKNEKKVKEEVKIKEMNEEKDKEETFYEIKLIYLNNYLEEGLEKFNTEINLDKTIPKTKYTEFLEESGLIEKMTYELKPIIKNYANYKKEIDKVPDQKKKLIKFQIKKKKLKIMMK